MLTGTITFEWFPSVRCVFVGVAKTPPHFFFNALPRVGLLVNNVKVADAWLVNVNNNNEFEGHCSQTIFGDKLSLVNSVNFSIANLKDYPGSVVKEIIGDRLIVSSARLTFESEEYIITCDKLTAYRELFEKLKRSGGYIVLYAGQIIKKSGPMLYKALEDLLPCFNHFLYFLNGDRTGMIFLHGELNGEIVLKDYTGYFMDPYKVVDSWSDISVMSGHQDLWVNFILLWKTERDFLETVIHWYIEANKQSAYVEGSIILTQTALELICNWLLAKKMNINLKKPKKDAAEKIRILLGVLKMGFDIPSPMTHLVQMAGVTDGPHAFVTIRNALVHGNKTKRKKLKSYTLMQKYECLKLGIWYVELALLYILKYKGDYHNRTTNDLWKNAGQPVPWNSAGTG